MNRRKKHKAPPFVMIRHDLLMDPIFRGLSSHAKVIYIYMRRKFNRKTFSEVSLTYSEVKDMCSTATISKCFKELQEKGFIEKTKYGGLFGGVCKYKFIGPYKDFFYNGYKV